MVGVHGGLLLLKKLDGVQKKETTTHISTQTWLPTSETWQKLTLEV
jgi:hypothetical protein